MWWIRHNRADHEKRVQEAVTSQQYADNVLAKVSSQDEEVKQVVTRLETRSRRNHFGEALTIAMERRNA